MMDNKYLEQLIKEKRVIAKQVADCRTDENTKKLYNIIKEIEKEMDS